MGLLVDGIFYFENQSMAENQSMFNSEADKMKP
jgi:hypothetical protein